MIGSPGGVARTIGLRVRKNAKPGTSEGLAYIIVKMLAVPQKPKPRLEVPHAPNVLQRAFLLASPSRP